MKKLIYVAGPYSGDIEENIKRAEEVSIRLIREGYDVITPHKNTAGYEHYEDENITYETWMELSLNILLRCDAIFVMKGSQQSKGTQREIKFAKQHNIEIINEKKNEWVVYSERTGGVAYTVKMKFGFFGCSCPAFKYRKGECKHIKKVKMRLAGEFQQRKEERGVEIRTNERWIDATQKEKLSYIERCKKRTDELNMHILEYEGNIKKLEEEEKK